MSRRGAVALVLIGALAAAALGGCTSPRNTLGTTTSPCFRSLAVAQDAVGPSARCTRGVRSTTLGAVANALADVHPPLVEVARPVPAPRTRVCVVAYRGDFRSSTIGRGWPGRVPRGKVALVVVRLRDSRVLDTVVLARPPFGFSRVFPPLR